MKNQRIYFDNGAKTYFKSCGTFISPLLDCFIFRNGRAGTDLLNIYGSGNSTQLGRLLVNGITCCASGSTTFLTSGGIATDNDFIVYSSVLSGGYNVNLGILNHGNTTIRGTVNCGAITT